MNNLYSLSQDYDRLLDFLDDGVLIAAFVDGDIVKAIKMNYVDETWDSSWYSIGVRGLTYFTGDSRNKIIDYCQQKKLKWIVPIGR